MIANYHTHTYRCRHAVGCDADYIEAAIAAGIRVLGFSDHAPMVFFDGHQSTYRILAEDARDYIDTLSRLREKYADKIEIHIGFEMEYYPKYFPIMLERVKLLGAEYLILGEHFAKNEFPDHTYSGSPTLDKSLLTEYVDSVIAGIQTGAYSYVAHPDLINYTENDEFYEAEMTRLCKKSLELSVPLEINMLGIWGKRHYPRDNFWRIVGNVGSPVIIGVDAHDPKAFSVRENYEIAEGIAKKYKLRLLEKCELHDIGAVKTAKLP